MKSADKDKLAYNVNEAADAVGVSRETVQRAIHAGDLPAYRPRVNDRPVNRVLILRDDLVEWVATGERVW